MMRRLSMALVTGALFVAAANACSSSSEEAAPSRPARPATTDDASTTGDGGVEDAAPPDPSCVADSGCYVCEPSKLVEFLNACTDQSCVPFDNVARLPLYKAGEALPPVP